MHDTYGMAHAIWHHEDWEPRSRKSIAEIRDAVAPFVQHLRTYDLMRRRLESRGGHVSQLEKITALLNHIIEVDDGGYHDQIVQLSNPKSIRAWLSDLGWGALRLAVRQQAQGLPLFYFCRVRQDYWAEYSLVVEDLYRSPGFDLVDDRFVSLMDHGHEVYYLRLSRFRTPVAHMLNCEDGAGADRVDEVLYDAGRHVFQAAWHDDQRLGVLCAQHFNLPVFHQAIELLYLCLSGDLCDLRGHVNKDLNRFFKTVYAQPALHAFLEALPGMAGSMLDELPQKALMAYNRLSGAFAMFLKIEVAWGNRKYRVPLHKVALANVGRFSSVGAALADDDTLHEAGAQLENAASDIIRLILKGETVSV